MNDDDYDSPEWRDTFTERCRDALALGLSRQVVVGTFPPEDQLQQIIAVIGDEAAKVLEAEGGGGGMLEDGWRTACDVFRAVTGAPDLHPSGLLAPPGVAVAPIPPGQEF